MARLDNAPPAPTRRWLLFAWAGYAALASGVAAHLLQLAMLGPWAAQWHPWTRWPHNFHFWLLESAAVGTGLALLLAHRFRDRIGAVWGPASPLQRWGALALLLTFSQAFMLLGFWLTKDHGVPQLGGLRAAFYLGGEWRLPALYSVAQLWLAGWLAWQCAGLQQQAVWRMASGLCVFLGFDELLSIHESVGVLVDHLGLIQADGTKTVAVFGQRLYLWQMILMPVALVAGLFLWVAFARATNIATTGLLLAGTLIFLSGALGMESIQAGMAASNPTWWATEAGHLNLLLEEGLEMLGVAAVLLVFAWHYLHGLVGDSRYSRRRTPQVVGAPAG